MAVGRTPGFRIELSEESLEQITKAEPRLVQSLLDDLDGDDEKLRQIARDSLLQLGFSKPAQESKGVVSFLLQRAREGKFGEHAISMGSKEKTCYLPKLPTPIPALSSSPSLVSPIAPRPTLAPPIAPRPTLARLTPSLSAPHSSDGVNPPPIDINPDTEY